MFFLWFSRIAVNVVHRNVTIKSNGTGLIAGTCWNGTPVRHMVNNQRPIRIHGLHKSRRSVGVAKPAHERSSESSVLSVAIFAAQVNAFGWAIVFKQIKAVYRSFLSFDRG